MAKIDLANWLSLPKETLLTVSDAAAIVGMSESSVYQAVRNEVLKSYRPPTEETGRAGSYRIMLADLID